MTKPAAVLFVVASIAGAQPISVGKPVPTNFDPATLKNIIGKPPHIHIMPMSCKGTRDGIYGKSGGTYYGCLNGKSVCSQEEGVVIPGSMIAEYEARKQQQQAATKEFRARMPRDGRTASEMRQRRSGVSRTGGGTTFTDPVGVPVAADRAPAATVTEEQVKEIALGTSSSEVLRTLGKPSMRITGDFERFTYPLASGKEAKLEFEGGKLTQSRIQ
jgi:hypothetical protein